VFSEISKLFEPLPSPETRKLGKAVFRNCDDVEAHAIIANESFAPVFSSSDSFIAFNTQWNPQGMYKIDHSNILTTTLKGTTYSVTVMIF
jgi:hypothetical protein